tara:strand:- start:1677 stop:1817 length:141 start_codon:yes stop_codon:yes gene_type:complete
MELGNGRNGFKKNLKLKKIVTGGLALVDHRIPTLTGSIISKNLKSK